MSEVVLRYLGNEFIETLVTDALKMEEKKLFTAILKVKEHLSNFENKYRLSTSEFILNPPNSLEIDNMEAVEWSREYETLKRIEERLKKTQRNKGLRVTDYFHQIEKIITECPAIIMNEVSYGQRTTHLGFTNLLLS